MALMGEKLILPGVSQLRLTPPVVPAGFLVRERLIERLDRPAPRNSFLIAPGGFGKSILAAQLSSRIKEPLLWYTINAGESAYESLSHIVQGLRNHFPESAAWFESLDKGAVDYKDAGLRLSNEIAGLGTPFAIILDGSDKFSPEFAPVVRAFADISPHNLRTVSLRHVAPTDSFIRAAKLDALSFLTAIDLRFTDGEIAEITSKAGLDYSDPAIHEQFIGTQGWPSGVALTIANLTSTTDRAGNSSVAELVAAQAINDLASSDRLYLESLIFLEEITFDLAQEFHQIAISSSGDHPLIRMSQNGIFLEEVSPGTFRMNSLIRAELSRQISVDQSEFKTRATQAVGIFERLGESLRAVEILAELGDPSVGPKGHSYLARIINKGDTSLLGKIAPQVSHLIELGGTYELNQMIIEAYIAQLSGRNSDVLTICKDIENHYPNIKNPTLYMVEIWGLRARAYFNIGAFSRVIAIADEMLESPLAKEGYGSVRIRITNILRLAVAASFLQEDYESTSQYSSLIDLPSDDVVNSVIIPATAAELALADGRYKHALEFAQTAIAASSRTQIIGVYSPFDAAYVMADCLRESGDELKALEIIDVYLTLAKKHGVWSWWAALMGKKAVVKAQLGQINESLNILRIAREELNDDLFDPEIYRILDESELIVREKLIDPERIGELLYRMPKSFTTESFTLVHNVGKNPAVTAELLSRFGSETPRKALMRELLLAQSVSSYPQEALKHLSVAVSIASKNGNRAIFTEQSSELQNLLLTLAEREPTIYMEKLAARIRAAQQGSMRSQMGLAEPLTKREVEILRRLSSGLPITQIASTLHISHNTIKTHLKSVYRKLNVESRVDAVERAKELLLL